MTGLHVAVVGAGPGGLAAADGALAAGARVTLVDAADQVGGQYHRMPPDAAPQGPFARRRARVLGHPRCAWLPGTAVWALERRDDRAPPRVHLLHEEARSVLEPDALVLAPGAHDRVLPFPGWELPGVFTAGAAQALAKGEGVAVGRQVLVAGTGPFLLPVTASLLTAGARVREVCEANAPATLVRGWSARPWELAGAGGKSAELTSYAALLARHRVPVRTGRTVVAARGDGRVEEAVTAALRPDWSVVPGSERTLSVDALCVGHGFTPQLELPLAAGCVLRDGFVAVDGDQRAGDPGVYAAGEITGVAGAPAARAEGALAGWLAAGGDPGARALGPLRRARDQGRAFARRLTRAHPVGAGWSGEDGWLREETVVCRCEETTYGALCAAVADPVAGDPRVVKLATRAGLGPCQGRMCGVTVAELTERLRERSSPVPAPGRGCPCPSAADCGCDVAGRAHAAEPHIGYEPRAPEVPKPAPSRNQGLRPWTPAELGQSAPGAQGGQAQPPMPGTAQTPDNQDDFTPHRRPIAHPIPLGDLAQAPGPLPGPSAKENP